MESQLESLRSRMVSEISSASGLEELEAIHLLQEQIQLRLMVLLVVQVVMLMTKWVLVVQVVEQV